MKGLPIFLLEFAISAGLVYVGVSHKSLFFINGERSAAIALWSVGLLLCAFSVGKFLPYPTHPLTLMGFLLMAVATLAFLTQVFHWNVPLIANPSIALFTVAACILIKGILARFAYLLVQ